MNASDPDDDTVEWPEPADDPDEEPSHPGARDSDDDGAET
jgi:hypothetical protein